MKAKHIILSLLGAMSIGFACTDLDNLNEDPNRVKDSDYDFSMADLGAALRYGSNLDYILTSGDKAGGGDLFDRVKNNLWETWSQYFVVWGGNPGNNLIEPYWTANYGTWMALLNGVIRDADKNVGRENSKAVALIWRAYMLSTFTDFFGPVPFSSDPAAVSPDYMAVDGLYKQFFADLEEAVELFDPAKNMISEDDFIFGGDMLKWKKFANSLRFNLALKVTEIDPELAKTQMKAALVADGGLLQSDADDVLGRWYDSWGNGPAYGMIGWNNFVMTTTMEKIVTGIGGMKYDGTATNKHPEYVDPRAVMWFDPSPVDDKNPAISSNFQGTNVSATVNNNAACARISQRIKDDN